MRISASCKTSMKIVAVIPARYASSRFPGKPLVEIAGKPMIQHVYERVKQVKKIDRVFVATDDKRIAESVERFHGEVVMTSSSHPTGTDRIAEAVEQIDADIILNVQGDEPLIEPESLSSLISPFTDDAAIEMATLYTKGNSTTDRDNPHVVKVVVDQDGYALYFSRAPIPFVRDEDDFKQTNFYKQLGVYAYTKRFLLKFVQFPQSMYEKAEKLEQLRALERGVKIKMVYTASSSIGVDTPRDLEEVKNVLKNVEFKNTI